MSESLEGKEVPKRFEAQTDNMLNIYEARRRGVQDGIREAMNENPDILGATMFGSLSKGKSHYFSDVDINIFFNADSSESKTFGLSKAGKKYGRGARDAIRRHVQTLRMPVDPHVIAIAMSDNVIDHAIKVLPLDSGIETSEEVSEEKELALYCLCRLFHLSITQGVNPFRSYLLERLLHMGQTGEEIWKEIIERTAQEEQFDKRNKKVYSHPSHTPVPKEIRYPWTLAEGIKLYAPHLLETDHSEQERGESET